jgi:phage terminase Nu1 subunit (DNA packaging protein)
MAKRQPKKQLLTRPELATAMGVVPSTITRWEADGMPVEKKARRGKHTLFDLEAVVAWDQARKEAEAAAHANLDNMFPRDRKELAQAIEAEQRVAIKASKLLFVEEVDRAWSAHVGAVRAKLMACPANWADRLHRAATLKGVAGVEHILDQMVRDVLTELADGEESPSARAS